MTREHEDIIGDNISGRLTPESARRGEPPIEAAGRSLIQEGGVNPVIPSQSKIVEIWAAIEERRKERVLQGLDKSIVIIKDTAEYERRRKLRTLSGTERISDVRFDETGNLYTTWYQPKKTEEVDGRRRLVNPTGQSYLIFPQRNRKEDYLNNLPKEKPVVELIFGESVILEEAIRQQQNILDGYQPGTAALEIEFARQVIAFSEGIALRFLIQRTLSRKDLSMLTRETGVFLENINLYDPHDPNKRGILNKLLTLGAVDSAGRPNYLGFLSKVLATHARAVDRLTIAGLITDKFVGNLDVLTSKREGYRWRFELAARELEMVLDLPAFRKRVAQRSEREAIINALGLIATSNLAVIEANPYLRSARWAAINIVGCREEKQEINREILGEGIAKAIFSKKPSTRLIKEGNFTEAGRRIRLSIAQLRKTLRDYEDIEKS